MDADGETGRRIPPQAACPASLAGDDFPAPTLNPVERQLRMGIRLTNRPLPAPWEAGTLIPRAGGNHET
jgi:hypothetical protein